MHVRATAGTGRRVGDAGPAGGEGGALNGYAQGYPKSDSTPEDESRSAVVLQAGAGKERPRVAVPSGDEGLRTPRLQGDLLPRSLGLGGQSSWCVPGSTRWKWSCYVLPDQEGH